MFNKKSLYTPLGGWMFWRAPVDTASHGLCLSGRWGVYKITLEPPLTHLAWKIFGHSYRRPLAGKARSQKVSYLF